MLRKTIVILQTFAFFVCQILTDTQFIPAETVKPLQVQEFFLNQIEQLKLKLSPYGSIQELSLQNPGKFVILLSDLHCDYQAQKNIFHALSGASKVFEQPLSVGVEGASGPVDLNLLKNIPIPDIKNQLSEWYLKRGFISGSDYFSSYEDAHLFGIEDSKLYFENLQAFQKSFDLRKKTSEILGDFEEMIEAAAKNIFPSEYNHFRKIQSKGSFSEWIREVLSLAKNRKWDILARSQLGIYQEISKPSSQVNPADLQKDYAQVIDRLKTSASKQELKKMILEGLLYRTGKTDQFHYLLVLKKLCREHRIEWKNFSAVSKQLKIEKKYKQIHLDDLLAEYQQLLSRLKNEWLQSPEQKSLENLFEKLETLQELSTLELTRVKARDFFSKASEFSANNLYESLQSFDIQKKISRSELTLLFDALKEARLFYEKAMSRDSVLFKNTFSRLQESEGPVVIVAGGFHKDGLIEQLKSHQISYLSFIPKTDAAQGTALYAERMLNETGALKEMLQTRSLRLAPLDRFKNSMADPNDIFDMKCSSLFQLLIKEPAIAIAWAKKEKVAVAIDYMSGSLTLAWNDKKMRIFFAEFAKQLGISLDEWLKKTESALNISPETRMKMIWTSFTLHEIRNALVFVSVLNSFGEELDKKFPKQWRAFKRRLKDTPLPNSVRGFESYFRDRTGNLSELLKEYEKNPGDEIYTRLRTSLGKLRNELQIMFKLIPGSVTQNHSMLVQFRNEKEVKAFFDDLIGILDEGHHAKLSEDRKRVKLTPVVWDIFRKETQRFGIKNIERKAPFQEVYASLLPRHLRQIIRNLVKNAREAGRQGVPLTLSLGLTTNADRHEGVLEIRDNGKGISPENLSRLFQLSFSTKGTGRGIGLYLTKMMVENWGGRIEVDSKEGGGTAFRITFPMTGKAAMPASVMEPKNIAEQGVSNVEIGNEVRRAISDGEVIALDSSNLGKLVSWANGASEISENDLADILMSPIEQVSEKAKRKLKTYLRNQPVRDILRKSLSSLFKAMAQSSADGVPILNSRRIVVLLNKPNKSRMFPLADGRALAHAGFRSDKGQREKKQGSIYFHIKTLQFVTYDEDHYLDHLAEVLKHEEGDLNEGFHRERPDTEDWGKIKELIVAKGTHYEENVENIKRLLAGSQPAEIPGAQPETVLVSKDRTPHNFPVLDALIIGAGPSGLMLAQLLKRLGLGFSVLEKGRIGESWAKIAQILQVTFRPALFSGLELYPPDWSLKGSEAVLKFLNWYVDQFHLRGRITEYQAAEKITPVTVDGENLWEVISRNETSGLAVIHYARNIITATGIFHSPRELGIRGEKDFPDKVFRVIKDSDADFLTKGHKEDKEVVIIGGGNTALLTALRLRKKVKKVTIVMPEDEIRWRDQTHIPTDADPMYRDGFKEGKRKIEGLQSWIDNTREGPDKLSEEGDAELVMVKGSRATEITSDKISVKVGKDGPIDTISYGRCYICAGFRPDVDWLQRQGIGISDSRVTLDPVTLQAMNQLGLIMRSFFLLGIDPVTRGGINIEQMKSQAEVIAGQILLMLQMARTHQEFSRRVSMPSLKDQLSSEFEAKALIEAEFTKTRQKALLKKGKAELFREIALALMDEFNLDTTAPKTRESVLEAAFYIAEKGDSAWQSGKKLIDFLKKRMEMDLPNLPDNQKKTLLTMTYVLSGAKEDAFEIWSSQILFTLRQGLSIPRLSIASIDEKVRIMTNALNILLVRDGVQELRKAIDETIALFHFKGEELRSMPFSKKMTLIELITNSILRVEVKTLYLEKELPQYLTEKYGTTSLADLTLAQKTEALEWLSLQVSQSLLSPMPAPIKAHRIGMDGFPEEKIDDVIRTATSADPKAVTVVYGKQKMLDGDIPLRHTKNGIHVLAFGHAIGNIEKTRSLLVQGFGKNIESIRRAFLENILRHPELKNDFENFRRESKENKMPDSDQIAEDPSFLTADMFLDFFLYRLTHCHVSVLTDKNFLAFAGPFDHWDLHAGTRRNAVYIPGGIYRRLALRPKTALAAALADEILDGILGGHTVVSDDAVKAVDPKNDLDSRIFHAIRSEINARGPGVTQLQMTDWIAPDLLKKFSRINESRIPRQVQIYSQTPEDAEKQITSALRGIPDHEYIFLMVHIDRNKPKKQTDHHLILDRAGYLRSKVSLIASSSFTLKEYEYLLDFSVLGGDRDPKKIDFVHVSLGRSHTLKGMSETFRHFVRLLSLYFQKLPIETIADSEITKHWFKKYFEGIYTDRANAVMTGEIPKSPMRSRPVKAHRAGMDGFPEEEIDHIIRAETSDSTRNVVITYGKQHVLEGDSTFRHESDGHAQSAFVELDRLRNQVAIEKVFTENFSAIRERFLTNVDSYDKRGHPELRNDYENFRSAYQKKNPDEPKIKPVEEMDVRSFHLFFNYRMKNAAVVVLKRLEFLDFQDAENHWDLHTGTRRNAVYIPGGIYEAIKERPKALAAAFSDEVLDGILGGHSPISDQIMQILGKEELEDQIGGLIDFYPQVVHREGMGGYLNMIDRLHNRGLQTWLIRFLNLKGFTEALRILERQIENAYGQLESIVLPDGKVKDRKAYERLTHEIGRLETLKETILNTLDVNRDLPPLGAEHYEDKNTALSRLSKELSASQMLILTSSSNESAELFASELRNLLLSDKPGLKIKILDPNLLESYLDDTSPEPLTYDQDTLYIIAGGVRHSEDIQTILMQRVFEGTQMDFKIKTAGIYKPPAAGSDSGEQQYYDWWYFGEDFSNYNRIVWDGVPSDEITSRMTVHGYPYVPARPADSAVQLIPGMIFRGKYQLVEKLGKGGIGEAWEAKLTEDTLTSDHILLQKGTTVVVKFANAAAQLKQAYFTKLLKNEAAILRQIKKDVPHLFDAGALFPHGYFIVMEKRGKDFLRSSTYFELSARLQAMTLEEGLSTDQALDRLIEGPAPEQTLEGKSARDILKAKTFFRKLLRKIDTIHEAGILHRDIKKSNILMEADSQEPVLMDFSHSKPIGSEERFMKYSGTPGYLAPETILGDDENEATDLFQTGVLFYELFVGQNPFSNNKGRELPEGPWRKAWEKIIIQLKHHARYGSNANVLLRTLTENPFEEIDAFMKEDDVYAPMIGFIKKLMYNRIADQHEIPANHQHPSGSSKSKLTKDSQVLRRLQSAKEALKQLDEVFVPFAFEGKNYRLYEFIGEDSLGQSEIYSARNSRGEKIQLSIPKASNQLSQNLRPYQLEISKDYPAMSLEAARQIQSLVAVKKNAVLLLPTGNTPKRMYQELVRMSHAGEIDLRNVTIFMLDEYRGGSDYFDFIHENLINRLPESNRPKAVHVLNGRAKNAGAEVKKYEKLMKEAGGVDLAVLGIGVEGHIGFNEAGSSPQTKTRLIDLAPSTIEANDEAKAKGYTQALTVGISNILSARKIILLANGRKKADIIQKFWSEAPMADIPATWLKTHNHVSVLVDAEAASNLPETVQLSRVTEPVISAVLEKIEIQPFGHMDSFKIAVDILKDISNDQNWKWIIERAFLDIAKEGTIPELVANLKNSSDAVQLISKVNSPVVFKRILAAYLIQEYLRNGNGDMLFQKSWFRDSDQGVKDELTAFEKKVREETLAALRLNTWMKTDPELASHVQEWREWLDSIAHPKFEDEYGFIEAFEKGKELLEQNQDPLKQRRLTRMLNLIYLDQTLRQSFISQIFRANPSEDEVKSQATAFTLLNPFWNQFKNMTRSTALLFGITPRAEPDLPEYRTRRWIDQAA